MYELHLQVNSSNAQFGDRTLGRSGHRGVVFTRSDWLASEYILN